MKKKTFNEWMKEVNALLIKKTGMDSGDLADVCYRDMYDRGERPARAANAAIKAMGDY